MAAHIRRLKTSLRHPYLSIPQTSFSHLRPDEKDLLRDFYDANCGKRVVHEK